MPTSEYSRQIISNTIIESPLLSQTEAEVQRCCFPFSTSVRTAPSRLRHVPAEFAGLLVVRHEDLHPPPIGGKREENVYSRDD